MNRKIINLNGLRINIIITQEKSTYIPVSAFLYLSAASYPPGPLPAKYFRRL